MVYNFFDKNSSGANTSGGAIKSKVMSNQELAEKLHKLIIRKFKKRKVYSSFEDNIWDTDLADMQIISKYNKGFQLLLYFMNIFSKMYMDCSFDRQKRCYNYKCFSKKF